MEMASIVTPSVREACDGLEASELSEVMTLFTASLAAVMVAVTWTLAEVRSSEIASVDTPAAKARFVLSAGSSKDSTVPAIVNCWTTIETGGGDEGAGNGGDDGDGDEGGDGSTGGGGGGAGWGGGAGEPGGEGAESEARIEAREPRLPLRVTVEMAIQLPE